MIDLRYAFQAQDSFYLVTDYFSRGSLETLLKRRQVSLDSCVRRVRGTGRRFLSCTRTASSTGTASRATC